MTGDQLGRPDGWGSGVDHGFEVETEVEFAEVKIELGSHAVKAQAAGFALDGGKDGVKSFVKGVGETAVPVGEDSLPVGLEGVGEGAHRRGEVAGRLLAEAANPFDQALHPVAGDALVLDGVDGLQRNADLISPPGPETGHVDLVESRLFLLRQVVAVLEKDPAVSGEDLLNL